MMRYCFLPAVLLVCVTLPIAFRAEAPAAAPGPASPPSTRPAARPILTDAEQQAGWKLLFDGVSTDGWRGLGMDGFPKDLWVVQDNCLHCLGGKSANDLVTVQTYENFELAFEWMVPGKLGNSGVKYRVQERKGNGFAFGPEYQCMNDPGATDKNATGSLYDVLPPHGKKLAPQGEFNQSRIVVLGNHVEHWLNGVKVVEFEFGSDALKEAVAKSKFKDHPEWAREPRGHIALQDHHDEVWFREIKVRGVKAPAG